MKKKLETETLESRIKYLLSPIKNMLSVLDLPFDEESNYEYARKNCKMQCEDAIDRIIEEVRFYQENSRLK